MISAILEFMTVAVAVVAIRSVHTGLYLTITNRGELQGTVSLSLVRPALNFCKLSDLTVFFTKFAFNLMASGCFIFATNGFGKVLKLVENPRNLMFDAKFL